MPSFAMPGRWSMALHDFSPYSDEIIGQNEKGEKLHGRKPLPSVEQQKNIIYPLGFQPFMRCHMQNGYGIYMREPFPLQEDFQFEKLKFKQSVKLSNAVFELMEGGKKIYPHEGLGQAQFIIDEIRGLTEFSEEAFEYALYRNHLYRLADRKQCLKDLQEFEVDGKKISIVKEHPWKISSGRRKRIDALYQDFSLEANYGIHIIQRNQMPVPAAMYEPWMLRSVEDEPGTVDFKLREKIECGDSIMTRNAMSMLAMLMTTKAQDF